MLVQNGQKRYFCSFKRKWVFGLFKNRLKSMKWKQWMGIPNKKNQSFNIFFLINK